MDRDHLAEIIGSSVTVSDKIRALASAGCARAEIARVLNKRYQHVRNVLEADKVRAAAAEPSGMGEEGRAFIARERYRVPDVEDRGGGAYRLQIREDGSVVVPEAVRKALGVGPGQPLMARLEGEEFKLVGPDTALRRVQDRLRPYHAQGVSWADDLIAERRREAERE